MRFFRPKGPASDVGDSHNRNAEPDTAELDFSRAKAKMYMIRETTRKISEINQTVLQATTREREDDGKKDVLPAVVSANNAVSLLKENILESERKKYAPEKLSLLICMFADVTKDLCAAQKKLLSDMKKKFKRQLQIVRPETSNEEVDILFMLDGSSEGLILTTMLTAEAEDSMRKYKQSVSGGAQQNDTALCLQNSIKDLDELVDLMMSKFPVLSATVTKRSFSSATSTPFSAEDKALAVELLDSVKTKSAHTLVFLLNSLTAAELNYLHTAEQVIIVSGVGKL